MKHLGDIMQIRVSGIEPVECITGGSPCQDLSLAGKRTGLAGERSGLFMEQIRIIKEMREIDRSIGRAGVMVRPRYMVWENVPGAFSSNKGKDFATVLEETIRIAEPEAPAVPVPEKGWPTAGILHDEMGTWSVAWRVHDAQFWGVPQRRRRIALVADFGGMSAPEILFERAGMSRDLEPSIPAWEGIARDPSHGAVGYDRMVEGTGDCLTPWDVQSRKIYEETGKWPAIYAGEGGGHGYVMQDAIPINDKATRWMGGGKSRNHDGSGNGLGVGDETDPMFTLTAGDRHAVCCIGIDGYNGCETGDKSITIRTRKSDQDHVGRVAIPINTQIATRHISLGERTGMGWGEDGDPAYTLQAGHEHAVCCLLNDQGGQSINVEDGVVSPTLRAESHAHEPIIRAAFTAGQGAKANGIGYAEEQAPTLRTDGGLSAMPTVICRAQANNMPIVAEKYARDIAHALRAKANCSFREDSDTIIAEKRLRWIVRRLTPLECERLQGYPDGWTDIPDTEVNGKKVKASDSARYKALGNSIALPFWTWMFERMSGYLPHNATMGSLFDGIGGFPLCWERIHGKGTARWASEVEPFCIAVSKRRLGE